MKKKRPAYRRQRGRSISGVYPLHGFAMVTAEDGAQVRIEVEDLRGSDPDNAAEAIVPDGYIFAGDPNWIHTWLTDTIQEAINEARDARVQPCHCSGECFEYWIRRDRQTS